MTPTELELLGLLQEECAEVIQIASKVRRFGYDSCNPYDPSGKSNLTLLQDEIGDVHAILALLLQEGNITEGPISDRIIWKLGKLETHWGYKLQTLPGSNDALVTDLERVLAFMHRLTKQGEDSLWRPSDAAIPVIEQAIKLLKRPQPRPFLEMMDEIFSKPGVSEAWEEMLQENQRDKKLDNICCDIRSILTGSYEVEGTDERKYLVRQAAAILKQIEELPEENEPEYED